MKVLLITCVIGILWVLAMFGVSATRSADTSSPPNYTGSSTSCSALQSEFNAAYARSTHGVDEGPWGSLSAVDAQMRSIGCYR